jgi:hypothetical protein
MRNLLPLSSKKRNAQIDMRSTRNTLDAIGATTEVILGKTVLKILVARHLPLRNAWSFHRVEARGLGSITTTKVNGVLRTSLLAHQLHEILLILTLRLLVKFIAYKWTSLLKTMLHGSLTPE